MQVHRSPSRRRSSNAGFTLVEIMLVVGIIVILMGVVLKNTGGLTSGAKITATEVKINSLKGAVSAYENQAGTVPSSEQGLRALVEKPSGRPEPRRWVKLLANDDIRDAWGNDFYYVSPARSGQDEFEIYSAGPDKRPNTADDISSVTKE